MYRVGQGGSVWLQPAGDVRNPYYGSVMLECYDEEHSIPVAGSGGDRDPQASGHLVPEGDR
jgi:hypothetical protein